MQASYVKWRYMTRAHLMAPVNVFAWIPIEDSRPSPLVAEFVRLVLVGVFKVIEDCRLGTLG